MPEDNKFDFEELKLPEDFSDSLEPLEESGAGQPVSEPAEAPAGAAPAEEDLKAEQADTTGEEGEAVPAGPKAATFLEKLSTADPFTVMLGITVAALLIAILCCLVELGRYHFDFGAKEAKKSAAVTLHIDSVQGLVSSPTDS
jgi:hypothetical protein